MTESEIQSKLRETFIQKMKEKECFLCWMLAHDEFSVLAHVQYEIGRLEKPLIDEVVQAGGFCNHHFHELLRLSNPPYLARFLQRLAEDVIHHKTRFLGLRRADCPLCNSLRKKETEYIAYFHNLFLSDTHFHEKYCDKGSLCLPHLAKVLKSDLPQEEKEKLLNHQMNIIKNIQENLRNLSRKSYYQAEKDEKEAPRQMTLLIVGRYGAEQ